MFELFCGSDHINREELIEKCIKIFGQPEVTEIVQGERASYKYHHIKFIRLPSELNIVSNFSKKIQTFDD
jgi:hypothetical protein